MEELLRDEQTIQVIRYDFAAIWPWAMIYDLRVESDVKRVCLDFGRYSKEKNAYRLCTNNCPHRDSVTGEHDATWVCPYGFWGFKHIIAATQHGNDDDLSTTIEIKDKEKPGFEMPVESSLVEHAGEHLKEMEKRHFATLDSRAKIRDTFKRAPEPTVLYFFCHGIREPGETKSTKGTYLVVGNNEKLPRGDLHVWTTRWEVAQLAGLY